MKAIYIDDEQYNHIYLKRLADEIGGIELVKTYQNAVGVVEECAEILPDIAFVDIEIPGVDGLELAERLQNALPQIDVVFVTAFSRYAVEAFRVNALDYLLKPVDKAELIRVIEKVKKRGQRDILTGGAGRGRRGTGQDADRGPDHGKELVCLGRMGIRSNIGYTDIEWITKKSQELFAYLLLNHGRAVDKWVLCDLLWPDVENEKVVTNLHTTVYRLKNTLRTVDAPVSVTSSIGHYRLTLENCRADFIEFEREAEQIADGAESSLQNLLRLERMYGGELFGGNDYIWAMDRAATLERYHRMLLYKIAERYRETSLTESLNYYQKIVKADCGQENAVLEIIRIYRRLGDVRGLEAYRRYYEERVWTEMGCLPSDGLRRAFAQSFRP